MRIKLCTAQYHISAVSVLAFGPLLKSLFYFIVAELFWVTAAMVAEHAGTDIDIFEGHIRPRSKSFTSVRSFKNLYRSEIDSALEEVQSHRVPSHHHTGGQQYPRDPHIHHHHKHHHSQEHDESAPVPEPEAENRPKSSSPTPTPRQQRQHRHRSCRKASKQREKSSPTGVSDDMLVNLSFCGCGFLGMYHLGVASCLMKYGQSFLSRVDRVAGASAGALIGALLVTSPTQQKVEVCNHIVSDDCV